MSRFRKYEERNYMKNLISFNVYILIKSVLIVIVMLFGLSACATRNVSNKCLTYTLTGDINSQWAPTKFYQVESMNILYIEIPKTVYYIPTLEVIDTEFNQPYTVEYNFDNDRHQFKVRDNYDKYLLYRSSADGLEQDKVYISCDRYIK